MACFEYLDSRNNLKRIEPLHPDLVQQFRNEYAEATQCANTVNCPHERRKHLTGRYNIIRRARRAAGLLSARMNRSG